MSRGLSSTFGSVDHRTESGECAGNEKADALEQDQVASIALFLIGPILRYVAIQNGDDVNFN